MESKYTKICHSRAWECKPFTLEFLVFRSIDNIVIKLQIQNNLWLLHHHQTHIKTLSKWNPNT